MLKPDLNEIAELLKYMAECNGGNLPELYRIAWHAYLLALSVNSGDLFDHNDFIELRDYGYFPTFDDDPDKNDPVLAMSIGKHYRDHDPNIPEGECLVETEFESLSWKIGQDAKHLGGKLTMPYIVAWTGKLLALHQCQEITDSEYTQLLRKIPEVPENPVKSVETFMSRYAKVSS